MRYLHRYILISFFLVVSSVATSARERILNFASEITVNADATIRVTEQITVWAENNHIKHGINRDLDTQYFDRYGNRCFIDLKLLSVLRDGSPETYRTSQGTVGKRIYLGDDDRVISPGRHTYTLTYGARRAVGFLPDHDELYWNVTGNGWEFAIEQASATVTLPTSIPRKLMSVVGDTGPEGAREQNYQASVDADGKAHFVITRPLKPQERFTIAVIFPKGYITKPSAVARIKSIFRDNKSFHSGLIGLLIILGYFFVVWLIVGKDPIRGTIVPRSSPPEGYSPSALRFICRMGYDDKVFAAAILNAAVKGYVTISDEDGSSFSPRTFSLIKKGNVDIAYRDTIVAELNRRTDTTIAELEQITGVPAATVTSIIVKLIVEGKSIDLISSNVVHVSDHTALSGTSKRSLAREEADLLSSLFGNVGTKVILEDGHYEEFERIKTALKKSLQAKYQKRLFLVNKGYFLPGAVLSIAMAILLIFADLQTSGNNLATLPGIGIVLFLCIRFGLDFKKSIMSRVSTIILGIMLVLFITLDFMPMLRDIVFTSDIESLPWGSFALLVTLLGTNMLFYHLLKVPTPSGRKLTDEIEGFRIYLEMAEKDEFQLNDPPKKSPELFEQYLPYALALDVEQAWSQKCAAVLKRVYGTRHPYHPGWYAGPLWNGMDATRAATLLGNSLSNAISSSTSPGSTYRSGGSSSSGGGRGGSSGW